MHDLARALIKGSAVLGTERVAILFSNWVRGEPIKYKIKALINALHVSDPLVLTDSLLLEPLPLATDRLPAYLPRREGMSAQEYIGRPVLTIESSASPPLFRPSTDPLKKSVQASSEQNVDIATVCKALSLQSNSLVDAAFYWYDYQDLWAFSLSDYSLSWSIENGRVRGRPKPFGTRTSSRTGVTTLLPKGDKLTLDAEESHFYHTLKALKSKESKKIRVAIDRWIMSKDSEKSPVDKSIDLRIALESLYLQDFTNEQSREMRFRLALFGAWHLGVDFEERKRIRKKMRDAYDTASKAVHEGDLRDSQAIRELLLDAQNLCRRGILKVLREGYPSQEGWGDLILGIEYNDQ